MMTKRSNTSTRSKKATLLSTCSSFGGLYGNIMGVDRTSVVRFCVETLRCSHIFSPCVALVLGHHHTDSPPTAAIPPKTTIIGRHKATVNYVRVKEMMCG